MSAKGLREWKGGIPAKRRAAVVTSGVAVEMLFHQQ